MSHSVLRVPMSRYRKEIEIPFPLSREPGGWMHDTLGMPPSLAEWLDANGFRGTVDFVASVVLHGRHTGYDSDDIHEFTFRGATVRGATASNAAVRNGVPVPVAVVNEVLGGEWESEFSDRLIEARNEVCRLF